MNIRGTISASISIVFIATFVLVGYNSASSQGRYTARYSKRDVSGTISKLEQSSNKFRSDFDRAMDNSNLNGTPSEDRFNNLVRDFENSVDRLRREFDSGDVWWESRNLVENMIRDARPVNTMMTTLPFRRSLERRWNQLRKDVNTLADTYDLAGLDGGGWNGGGGGGGNTSTPPSWARGTFYSTNGSGTTLTINQNGTASVYANGQTYYGTYYRNELTLNNDVSTISRDGDGIRTYNRNTGQTTNYSRTNTGGDTRGGNTSTPPSWARGTFYSTNGSGTTLTINQNGTASVYANGQTYYGTYYRNELTLNNDVSTISRDGDGIRTYNRNTGQTTNYSRTNSGGDSTGGNTSTPPKWARGTFYSTNGTNIQLTINSDGSVTANVGGQTYNGTYYEGSITLNNDTSTVSRDGDGIRTYNRNTGQTTNYRRN